MLVLENLPIVNFLKHRTELGPYISPVIYRVLKVDYRIARAMYLLFIVQLALIKAPKYLNSLHILLCYLFCIIFVYFRVYIRQRDLI